MQTVSSSFLVITSMGLSGPRVGGMLNCQVVSVQGRFHKGESAKDLFPFYGEKIIIKGKPLGLTLINIVADLYIKNMVWRTVRGVNDS